MIISHKYKFIFIKTAKTAGTSIEVFLSQHCGEDDVVTPILPPVESHCPRNYKGFWNPLPEIISDKGQDIKTLISNIKRRNKFYNHIPAKLVKQRISRQAWNSYFKFCVERNPWDKTLSHYHMMNSRGGGDISFDDYLERGIFSINYPTYCDSRGTVLVDKVLKYESIMNELGNIFQELGIPFDGSLGVRAKAEHRKDRRSYQDLLSIKQRDIISRVFEQEINLHGYVF